MQIAGFEIQNKKKIVYSLKSIYGVGKTKGFEVCKKVNINPQLKWDNLTKDQQVEIIDFIERYFLIGDKKKKNTQQRIKSLQENGSYKGFRHRYALPVNGQRTHSNARSYKRIRSFIKSKKKR